MWQTVPKFGTQNRDYFFLDLVALAVGIGVTAFGTAAGGGVTLLLFTTTLGTPGGTAAPLTVMPGAFGTLVTPADNVAKPAAKQTVKKVKKPINFIRISSYSSMR